MRRRISCLFQLASVTLACSPLTSMASYSWRKTALPQSELVTFHLPPLPPPPRQAAAMVMPLWERNSFFKVMIGDFQASLRVPPSFHKHLCGDLHLKKAVLTSRGGQRWVVELRMEGESLFFGDGWGRFVADLSIELGEFLIFVHDGSLGFDVKVYGITGCERDDPTLFIKGEVEEEEAGTSGALVRCQKRRREVVNGRVILEGLQVFKNGSAMKSARSFNSTHPFYIATYRSTREEYMTIPMSFMRECKLGKIDIIILQDPKGRSWHIRIAHWTGRVAFAAGWSEFRNRNYLKEGDVCVFEFVEPDNTIHVHIFRAKGSTMAKRRMTGTLKNGKAKACKSVISFGTAERFSCVCFKYRKYNLTIPTRILKRNHTANIRKTTLSDPSGREWSVHLSQRKDGRIVLGHGWSDFWKANQLKEGDICVFQLSGGIQAMDVQIWQF